MRNLRVLSRAVGVALMPLALTGCVGPQPSVDLPGQFEKSSGLADAVVVRTEGESLDVTNTKSEVLELDDAVRRTLAHDPGIQAAIARVRVAEAEASQSRLLPNPVVSVLLRFPEGGGTPDIEAGLTADLISILRRPGQVSVADNRLRGAAADAVTTVLNVLAEVRQRYAAAQSSDQLVGVLEDRLAAVDRLLQLARDRLQAGEGTRLDVLTLDAQRVEIESELADQQLERLEERLAIARLIGEPSSPANWALSPWQQSEQPIRSATDWVAAALANRPEIQAGEYELAALGAEASLVKFSPFDGAYVGVGGERDNGDWSVGPAVSSFPIPLFDFGQAKRARARAAIIEARHNLTKSRREAVEQTRVAYAGFQASAANLARVRDRLIPSLQQRFAQAEAQFRAGETDSTTLLIAEQELRAGRMRLVTLQRRNTESLVRLQRAAGGFKSFAATSQPTTKPATTTTTTAPATAPATRPSARTPAPAGATAKASRTVTAVKLSNDTQRIAMKKD